jgi:pimeloyl-ACP methyl ester carboxylesterase
MAGGHVILIHGIFSSPNTWDKLHANWADDPELSAFTVHRFGYESPKLPRIGALTRIPDYDSIAQSLRPFLSVHAREGDISFVTHSQGGLILLRFLAWMLNEGRGRELARVRSLTTLACPHEGSDFLASVRALVGRRFNPQAEELKIFDRSVAASRRTVQNQIVHASTVSDRECPIPLHVYGGSSDNIVKQVPAQGTFPDTAMLPGDHFNILDPAHPGSLTAAVVKHHLLQDTAESRAATSAPPPAATRASGAKFNVTINNSQDITVGDGHQATRHYTIDD